MWGYFDIKNKEFCADSKFIEMGSKNVPKKL
jgi:hypothetical protein